jgi:flagellar export protein FliJ
MTPPSKRFQPIQRIALDKERKAAAALGDALKRKQTEEQRLAELRAYQAEYLERYRQCTQQGASAARLREYQLFLDNLAGVICEQERYLSDARENCSQNQDRWRERYVQSKVMDSVIDRLKESERQLGEKLEQNLLDEHNQRRS